MKRDSKRNSSTMKKTQGIGANFIRKDGEASEQKKDHTTENDTSTACICKYFT